MTAPGAARLAIVGTRILACAGDRGRAAVMINDAIASLQPGYVISGGADGIDSIAERCAGQMGYRENNGKLLVFRPTVKFFHGPGGYRERDKEIAHACTHLLRLACCAATTYGSGWTADEAERIGRLVRRQLVCPDV